MDAKLDNLCEISKLLSVKSEIRADLLSLFGKFGLGRLLCRLSLEKHDGISAVQLILSLCLFRFCGETVYSMYKKNFYNLLETGKNCYYRMLNRPAMDWRRLMNYVVIRFYCILRKEGIAPDGENSCAIIDDTTMEKSGKRMERISKVFDHVQMRCVLGYKCLLSAFFDGKSTLPFDFSLHEERGDDGKCGLTDKQRKGRFHKKRSKDNPDYEREKECGKSKLAVAVEMVDRMWKCGLRPRYVLADSWFTGEEFIKSIRKIAKGAIHYIGLAKMGNAKYLVEGRKHCAADLVTLYERTRGKYCRKYKCRYIMLTGKLGDVPVRIYLIKYGRSQHWNIMLSTETGMPFVRAFELYQIRWNIEVINKETKEHLGLGSYAGRDLDGQIADTTLCYITYTVVSLEKRLSCYETFGGLFADLEEDAMALTLWRRTLAVIEHLLEVLGDILGYTVDELMAILINDANKASELAMLADEIERRHELAKAS